MTEKEKLIELLTKCEFEFLNYIRKAVDESFDSDVWDELMSRTEFTADHLIANGVTFREDAHWATEQAYKNGYEAGVKSVTDNNFGDKMTPTDKDINVLTNADRIRAMTDEELCEFLGEYKFCDICEEGCDACTYSGDCDKRLLDWLKQPAEVDNG